MNLFSNKSTNSFRIIYYDNMTKHFFLINHHRKLSNEVQDFALPRSGVGSLALSKAVWKPN